MRPPRRSTWSATPAWGWAPTRWAGRAWPTGGRSPNATATTCPASTPFLLGFDSFEERIDRLAREAEERVAEAEGRTRALSGEGHDLAAAADTGPLELDDMTKAELVELAQGMGLEVNGHTLKKELVTAIRRSRP